MSIETMCINIPVDLKADGAETIRSVIYGIIKEANEQVFAVESVTIGDETVFKHKTHFMGVLKE